MSLFFMTFVFLEIVYVEGVPNNYEHQIQSRGITDFPIINWFFKNQTSAPNNKQYELKKIESGFHEPVLEYSARKIEDKISYYNSKQPEVLYSDLEEVENLLKDPSLDLISRHSLISFIHKWHDTFFQNEKIKNKLDELVRFTKRNSEYDQFYEKLVPIQKISKESKEKKIKDLNSKKEISYAELQEMENLLECPSLDSSSKRDLINIIHKWNTSFVESEKMKPQFDKIIQTIKRNPDYNELYNELNPLKEEKIEQPVKKPPSVFQLEDMLSSDVSDHILKNIAIVLRNPLEDSAFKKYLIKTVYSWRLSDNFDETLKKKFDELIINAVKNDPENYRFFKEIWQASK